MEEPLKLGGYGTINVPGIGRLWLIPADQVLAVLEPDPTDLDRAMIVPGFGLPVADSADIVEVVFPPRSATFSENYSQDGAGKSYSYSIQASVPGQNKELMAWLSRNAGRRWIAIWTDRNGQTYLAGDPENGLRMTTGRGQTEINTVRLQLTGRSWHPAWLLEDSDLMTLIPYSTTIFNLDSTLYD